MSTEDTTDLIVQYVTSPKAKRPLIVNKLSISPDAAFETIFAFRGPYPESLHPREVHETLFALLPDLLKICPRLFIECEIKTLAPDQRYQLICAAIETQESRFKDGILSGLKDRSIYVKLLVIDAIRRYRFLRTADARKELERLLTVKSIAESEYHRKQVENALRKFTR
jgi:hypothetical protein